jgi:hypothetical protein
VPTADIGRRSTSLTCRCLSRPRRVRSGSRHTGAGHGRAARVSEYQYYEFLALDKPLTRKQREELRQLSTRAEITATRFTDAYHWATSAATRSR